MRIYSLLFLIKANISLKKQQYESTIQNIKTAEEQYLKKFPLNSSVVKRGNQLIKKLRNKITNEIETKLDKWLMEIGNDQGKIGSTLYQKVLNEQQKMLKF